MPAIELQDRSRIAAFLERDPYLHLYGLGDLDDFFWPHTRWFGLEIGDQLCAVCFLYSAHSPAIFQALASPSGRSSLNNLLPQVAPELPSVIYAHLSPGLENRIPGFERRHHHGLHHKMGLLSEETEPYLAKLEGNFELLHPHHLPALLYLYRESYPEHAFDARMLETGRYLGFWYKGHLIAAGGVHVHSLTYQVAALGNITTHPDFRGQGLATAITSRLCQILRKEVQFIGLNVRADNHSALTSYAKLGFQQTSTYHEWTLFRI